MTEETAGKAGPYGGREQPSPEGEASYRDLVDHLPQAVFEIDHRGDFTYVNKFAFELFGFRGSDEWRGRNCLQMVAPVDRERAGEIVGKVLGGRVREGTEYRLQRKDGSTFPAMVYSRPVFREGKAAGMQGVIVDLVKIRHAEERLLLLEKVLDEAPDGIQIVDLEGHVMYSNKAVEGIYGFKPEELRGRHVDEMNEDPTFAGREIVPSIKAMGSWEGELMVRHRDGHSFPIWLSTSIVGNPGGSPAAMVGTIKDLTERRRGEEELRHSEEMYRTVIENTGTGMIIIDRDMTVSFANAKLVEFTGLTKEELVGRPFPLHLIAPEDRERVAEYHRRRREDPDQVPYSYEFSLAGDGKQGKHFFITVTMIPGTDKSIASLLDVTDRVRSERGLRESEEKFRNLAENSPNMIFINQGGRVVYANQLSETILGYSREELYSPDFDFRDLIAPDSIEIVGKMYRIHQEGGEVPPYEYGLLARNGERIDVMNSARLITYGGHPAILGIVMDITARKRAEEDLEQAYGELEVQNRKLMKLDEIKDGLIRDVSHELKTPVAKHAMQLEILKPVIDAHRLSEEEQKALVVMEESIRRQESVIRNLLDLSRLEAGGRTYLREPVRLDRLLQEVVEDYAYATDAYGMTVDFSGESQEIRSDSEMLRHLFSNILNNAIKFRRGDLTGKVRISMEQGDGEIEVRISDNGVGMEREDIERAFSRFFQVSAACEGSGVGLTICRMIAEGLGGGVRLESEGRGKGVTAAVTLPLSRETMEVV
jgi:PAS domain S-box-containing protein